MPPNIVFFEGEDTTSTVSLWETDGTASGTFELTDGTPPPLITGEAKYGFASYLSVSFDLTLFNNQVLFGGRIGPGDIGPYTLWTSDGTARGTVPLTIAGANSNGLFSATVTPGFTVFGAEVLFRGEDTGSASGLWTTNGTASGTQEVTGIAGAASTGVSPTDITVLNDTAALFNGVDTADQHGLWTTDGAAGGTRELTSIGGAATSGLNPADMKVFNGEVLFNGADAGGQSGLWMTDGSAAGTHEVTGIAEAATTGSGLDPTDMTVFVTASGSKVLFGGVDAAGLTGLWVTDGTAGGTHEVFAEAAGATARDPLGLSPTSLAVFNGEVFFSGFDKYGRKQLWETDGTATQMLTVAGVSTSFGLDPSNLYVYNGQLVFQGTNLNNFPGLWTTNGTAAGTHEISPASGTWRYGFGPTDLTALTPGSSTPPPLPPSDILWQNIDGQAAIWEMSGNTQVGGGAVNTNPGPNWRAVGTGDFNDDGQPDILWQNVNTGQASIWEMNGDTLIGGGAVTPNPGLNWHAVGSGDFYHDGFADILWQNTSTGQISIWEMNGVTQVGGGPTTLNPGTNWNAIGTGDFNKDGNSDILFQNKNTGQISIWEMNGNTQIGGGVVTPNPGTNWQAIGTGDFNQDGYSDILFQNKNTGQISVWEMDGTSLIGGGPVSANPGTNWHAIGTGAGGSDILLQSTSGQTTIWEMNGNTIAGGGPVSPTLGLGWRAVGLT